MSKPLDPASLRQTQPGSVVDDPLTRSQEQSNASAAIVKQTRKTPTSQGRPREGSDPGGWGWNVGLSSHNRGERVLQDNIAPVPDSCRRCVPDLGTTPSATIISQGLPR